MMGLVIGTDNLQDNHEKGYEERSHEKWYDLGFVSIRSISKVV